MFTLERRQLCSRILVVMAQRGADAQVSVRIWLTLLDSSASWRQNDDSRNGAIVGDADGFVAGVLPCFWSVATDKVVGSDNVSFSCCCLPCGVCLTIRAGFMITVVLVDVAILIDDVVAAVSVAVLVAVASRSGIVITFLNIQTWNSLSSLKCADSKQLVSRAFTIQGELRMNRNITAGSTIVALGGLDMYFLEMQENTKALLLGDLNDTTGPGTGILIVTGGGWIGALNVQGGITVSIIVMVSGNIYVHRSTSLNQLPISNTRDGTSPQIGCAILTSGKGIGKSLYTDSNVIVEDAMSISSQTELVLIGTKAMVVQGVFDSTMHVSDGISTTSIVFQGTDEAISGSTGSFQTLGGLSLRKSIFIGGNNTAGNLTCLGNVDSAVQITKGITSRCRIEFDRTSLKIWSMCYEQHPLTQHQQPMVLW
ncbi:hypothetical protein BDK51DRAFT_27080 [Blyttiomyces helicus]|uniref:Uncharacterized protein n=1 Tax=Blyttiomyces helicus TaxID=388810 RepID=A0A4V1ISU6_9FUNG|nr:hypothetical protein BDK51DRAFT_27080 [Blyttiomyces helicus]|eukprot:RKO94787.1 hypothetical protein BDK51DRAFT_27080 [Blyttiomyces helicus]